MPLAGGLLLLRNDGADGAGNPPAPAPPPAEGPIPVAPPSPGAAAAAASVSVPADTTTPAPRDPDLDRACCASGFTYRELLTGIGERLETINAALADPRCTAAAGNVPGNVTEACHATDMVKLGYLLRLCSRAGSETSAQPADALMNSAAWNDVDQQHWYEAREQLNHTQRAMTEARAACAEHQAGMDALPALEGLIDFGDRNPRDFARTASYLEQAARLGGPVSPREYAHAVNVLSAGYTLLAMEQGGMEPEDWRYLVARQTEAEAFMVGEIAKAPVQTLMGLARFETLRIPPASVAGPRPTPQAPTRAQYADVYQRALVYYHAAETLTGRTFGDSTRRSLKLDRAEQYLGVNDIELARHEGSALADEYRQ